MIISSVIYISIEIAVLTMIPVLVMLKIPKLFSKRHLIMMSCLMYVIFIASKLQFELVETLIDPTFLTTVFKNTLVFTAISLFLIFILYKVNPMQVIKMTKIVNPKGFPWYAPIILYPLLSVPLQEILFRWYILNRLSPLFSEIWIAVVISAVVFAVVHLPFASKIMVLGTFVLGIWWGFVFIVSGSIWPSTISHMIIGTYVMWLGIGSIKQSDLIART